MSRHSIALCCGFAASLAATGALAEKAPADEETAKDIVATTVRSQGYACEQPERAERDPAVSLPDQVAWVLDCTNAKYWVRYNDDLPAEIRKLD